MFTLASYWGGRYVTDVYVSPLIWGGGYVANLLALGSEKQHR